MLDLEFYYLSGLPIDLRPKGLGIIHQPRLIDFISNDLDNSSFSQPFFLDKRLIIKQDKELEKSLESVGKLKFLSIYNKIITQKNPNTNIVYNLKKSLSLLYKVEVKDIIFIETLPAITIGKEVLINEDNFPLLCNLVLEMLRLDLKDIEEQLQQEVNTIPEEEDPILQKFKQKEKEFNEKVKKNKKEQQLFDIVNVVVHGQEVFDYEKVFNMTIYQIKNSYSLLLQKEVYNASLLHRISPNFSPSNDLKLWEEGSNTVKSSLNQQNQ